MLTVTQRKERLPLQLPPPATVVCAACRQERRLSEFTKFQGALFGVKVFCLECAAVRLAEWRLATKLQL